MAKNHTHICIILDRSGSMQSIRDDTVGGFNAFVEQQCQIPGQATLTLVQFDTEEPFDVVHAFVPVREIPKLTRDRFVPRGGTPLLDAVGRAIEDTEQALVHLAPICRPDAVIIVIITDGQENSSRQFTQSQIQRVIKSKQELLGWEFVFLSADLGAIDDAVASGIKREHTMSFDKTQQGARGAWETVSDQILEMRSGRKCEMSSTDSDEMHESSAGGSRPA